MNLKTPLVSIGMPVFNCEKTVGVAIRSILNQTYANWELLVIDDGSSDGTLTVARSFDDPRVHVFADGRRKTLAPRLNEAVSLGRGKYFARMDGDDVSYPERLELQVDYLERNPGTDLVGAGVVVFRGDREILGTRAVRCTHDEICRRPRSGFALAHPTWVGRAEWFRGNAYRADAVRCEDQDLLLRTCRASRFAGLPQILLGYREEELSLRRILSGRRSFAQSAVRRAIADRQYTLATLVALEQSAKSAVDALAISVGLDYKMLRHRARPADEATKRRWAEVWEAVQEATAPPALPRTSLEGQEVCPR